MKTLQCPLSKACADTGRHCRCAKHNTYETFPWPIAMHTTAELIVVTSIANVLVESAYKGMVYVAFNMFCLLLDCQVIVVLSSKLCIDTS